MIKLLMKQMQYNAQNIKKVEKQVWWYFIRRTMWPGYAGTTTIVHIVLNTQKNTCQILLPKKILRSFPSLEILDWLIN